MANLPLVGVSEKLSKVYFLHYLVKKSCPVKSKCADIFKIYRGLAIINGSMTEIVFLGKKASIKNFSKRWKNYSMSIINVTIGLFDKWYRDY